MAYHYPIITIVGANNTGKSFLYNILTKTNEAIVNSIPGFTRDRQYGYGYIHKYTYVCVDTGNYYLNDGIFLNKYNQEIKMQTIQAIKEADLVILLVRDNILNTLDYQILQDIRTHNKHILLLVNSHNKIDIKELLSLGCDIYRVNLLKNSDLKKLYKILYIFVKKIYKQQNKMIFNNITKDNILSNPQYIKIAVVGMPNVGKSTLINRIIKKNRIIMHSTAGTTRNCIIVPIENYYNNYKNIILIDTPGIYKNNSHLNINTYSYNKTIITIKQSNMILFIIDGGKKTLYKKDIALIQYIINQGKSIIIIINKYDLITSNIFHHFKKNLYKIYKYLPVICISAKTGRGCMNIFKLIYQIYNITHAKIKTSKLMNILYDATNNVSPNIYKGRRIKIKFIHIIQYNPLVIMLHGNQVTRLNNNYKRYLINILHTKLGYIGSPIILQYKNNHNPYIH
ncbi:ribosome biogenesis GTPase Der [Enterobacteriaceae endosymbiont of Macroplea mutica]|uniref:ribosome biogenesis GTPase Der n=1 Tax=Enterobacteriaceae endosymbiont of Macroplea mutica TaxID=2675791 RepID=UPI0014495218|nr:ribosome biogenesis GTPase Der [Enterobacteriaceae endosymbiont of Macroplea mutica]QJC31083.1 ribosome biogenesis GTPase Der [Enterobacteriaceae endosymbiont of Macroplea mutica]